MSVQPGRPLAVVAIALVACTDGHAVVLAEIEAAPASSGPAVDPVASPAPVSGPAPAPAPPSPPRRVPMPAFAIATTHETIVAPLDGSIAVERAPGIWVLDDAILPYVARFHPGESPCGEPTRERSCAKEDTRPVALVGGVLFLQANLRNTCDGMNLYDVESWTTDMVASPGVPSPRGLGRVGCNPEAEDDVWTFPLVDECADEAARDENDCELCDEVSGEVEAYAIHRGRLWRIESGADPMGIAARRWSSRALSPARCPSAADTCGSPKLHAGLGKADAFWVANDGVHALRLDHRTLTIVGRTASVARGELGEHVVLGVRFHADATALVQAMREQPTGC